MDKNKQKIIAVSVGLVISILMIVVGVRIMQKRGSRASTPLELVCTIAGNEGSATWKNNNPEMMMIGYGTDEAQYPFLAEEETAPESIDSGSYKHTVSFGPLNSDSSYYVQVSGFEDATAKCIMSNEESTQSVEVEAEELESTNPLTPTAVPTQEATPTLEDDEEEATVRIAPSAADVSAFYGGDGDISILSCCNHFAAEEDSNGNSYIGIAAVCSQGWAAINLSSTSTN